MNTVFSRQIGIQLGIPRNAIFPRAVREPANNNGCGLLQKKKWGHLL